MRSPRGGASPSPAGLSPLPGGFFADRHGEAAARGTLEALRRRRLAALVEGEVDVAANLTEQMREVAPPPPQDLPVARGISVSGPSCAAGVSGPSCAAGGAAGGAALRRAAPI